MSKFNDSQTDDVQLPQHLGGRYCEWSGGQGHRSCTRAVLPESCRGGRIRKMKKIAKIRCSDFEKMLFCPRTNEINH